MAENGAATENGAAEPATGRDPVDLPLAVVDDVATTPVLLMVHTDHLGRPIIMTDATKATVWAASYKPWGEPVSISGTRALNLRFPGQYFQIETNLAYNWHRHYDTTTGRYTQPDPLGFVDGPSIYAYAANSPFMKTDPTGESATVAVLPVAGGLVIVDGPFPVGDALAAGLLVGARIYDYCMASSEEDGTDCEKLLRDDTDTCNAITKRRGGRAGARCHHTAAERYAACLRGRPLPPLDTWNN
jgi:RHS repeat-associated protein